MLILLSISMLTLAFNIQQLKAESTIWTVGDGGPFKCSISQASSLKSTPESFYTSAVDIIHPQPGQFAHYFFRQYVPPLGIGWWNTSYNEYVQSHIINTTHRQEFPYMNDTYWCTVDTTSRWVTDTNPDFGWNQTWYVFWIETNVTGGSVIDWWTVNTTIVGSETLYVVGRDIDCWVANASSEGSYILSYYDKLSGLLVKYEDFVDGELYMDLTLNATNIISGMHDWWPMFRHDLRHTGYSTSTAPNTNNTLWTRIVPNTCNSPIVVDSRVFVEDFSGNLHALNESTGAVLWSRKIGPQGSEAPAYADGIVFVGSYGIGGGMVSALNATNGNIIWQYQTGGMIWSSPAVADGNVFIGSLDNKLYAFNGTTGALLWTYTTGGEVWSSPAVANGVAFIGSNDHKVYALNETDGQLIWSYTTGNEVMSSPAIVGGKVFVGTKLEGKVYALNETDGTLIWSYQLGGSTSSSPAVAYGKVFIGDEGFTGHKAYALNETSGDLIWSYQTADNVGSSPAVADGKVFVGSTDSNIYALDQTNGTLLWKYNFIAGPVSSPAIANGKVFVGFFDGVHSFGQSPPSVTTATIDIDPNTLNLKSRSKWITCYIELLEGYDVSDIDISTVMLNGEIQAELHPTEIGDYDTDGIPDLMVKFDRAALTSHIYHTLGIRHGHVTLTVTGQLTDGTMFEGGDTIKIKFGGDADLNEVVDLDDFYLWRENFGKTPDQCPPDVHPDFDDNEHVDLDDFYVWRDNFGATVPSPP